MTETHDSARIVDRVTAPRWGLILAMLSVVGVDQLTKQWAVRTLRGSSGQSFLADIFRLQYAENPGAFLSLGAALSKQAQFLIFTVGIGVFLAACLIYLLVRRQGYPTLPKISAYALALVTAGGLSNLVDRLFRADGRVVDFLNLGLGNLRTGIFNLADSIILVGVGLLLIPQKDPTLEK